MKGKSIIQATFGTLAAAMVFSVSAQTSSTAPTVTEGAPPPPAQNGQGANKDTSYPQGASQQTKEQNRGSSHGMSQSHGTSQGTGTDAPRTSGSQGGENATKMPHTPQGTAATPNQPGEPGHTTSQEKRN